MQEAYTNQGSCLRYPGGKSSTRKFILQHIPDDCHTLISPFFGGGSVELEFLKRHPENRVLANDKFAPLTNFWLHLKNDQNLRTEILRRFERKRIFNKEAFSQMEQKLQDQFERTLKQAADFYVMNRCSYNGTTLSGEFSNSTNC